MKLLSFLLLPALLAGFTSAELQIMPARKPHVHDLTLGSSSPVTFTCQAVGKTVVEAELKWFDSKNAEITATQGNTFVQDDGDLLVLRIASPSDADAGTYTCRGVVNGVEDQASITLEVYRGINVTSPKTQYLVKGTDAKVWCRMEQTSSQKRVTWYHQGWVRIRTDDKYYVGYSSVDGEEGDYLEIRNITLENSGVYICNIDMMVIGKSHAHFINVIVTVPPKIMGPITLQPSTPKEGDRLQLTCNAVGTPPPTYSFTKDGQDLEEESNTDGHYVIEEVKRTDEGLYKCVASNHGGFDEAEVDLDVRIPPTIEDRDNIVKEENTAVRFPCVATGDPAPSMFWRREGSPVDFLPNADQEIYVEEINDAPDQDGVTKVYRRTLELVIPVLKPSHAAKYVCKAENEVDMVEKTFEIVVQYKPNFDNQVESEFWGWVGSKTYLTCIANGNPEPVIKWYKDGQDLSQENGYTIIVGESDIPTRAISHLYPTVEHNNVGTVFGDYKCEAENKFGRNEEMLTFKKAEAPDGASITVVSNKPTELKLRLGPPPEDGGQPVTQYFIQYSKLNDPEETEKTVERFAEEQTTDVILTDLTPKTQYNFKVYAVNSVGRGKVKNFVETTSDISRPDPVKIVSNREGLEANKYTLMWTVPMTGGAEISNYKVEYAVALEVNTNTDTWTAVRVSPNSKTLNVEGEDSTQVEITGLTKNTYYQVKVKAMNRIGSSDEATFIFKTGAGEGAAQGANSVRASLAGMVLVVVVTAYLQPLLC